MNIASVVATARHGTKLHVIDRDSFPDDFFYHSLDSFHNMIKEFETPVVTSLQSITFSLCNMLMMKLSSQSDGMTPFSYHAIGKVSDQPCTSIARRLQHFCYYSRGTSSFASFHLDDSFHHHLNIYTVLGGPTTGSTVRSSGFQENSSFRSRS